MLRVLLHICACVRVNCTSLGVANMLWECRCLCVCLYACERVWCRICVRASHCLESKLLGLPAGTVPHWQAARLEQRARLDQATCLRCEGVWQSSLRREREREEEETAKAAQEQRAGAGSCPPQQDETLSQEISAGSERKRCCVLTRT